jgi:hypothetical protein
MARIYSNEGLIQNQGNSSSYMRTYSCGKNDSGGYYKFNILTGNPHIYINMTHYYSFTNNNTSHVSITGFGGLYFDTSGNGATTIDSRQSSQGDIYEVLYNVTNRQAIVCLASLNSGFSATSKGSIISNIFCNNWDYVTITQL